MITRYSKKKVEEILELKGVPRELWDEAISSIDDGYKKANGFKQWFHTITAPIGVPLALIGVPWEAEHLPEGIFKGYDNDATINGDVYVWENNIPHPIPLEKDSQFAIESNYWVKGKHPRAFVSRCVWMGWRNTGKETYLFDPEEIPGEEQVWGNNVTMGGKTDEPAPGWQVSRNGKHWQIRGVIHLGGNWYQEVRWGWKLGLWLYHYTYLQKNRVMATGVNLKFKKYSAD